MNFPQRPDERLTGIIRMRIMDISRPTVRCRLRTVETGSTDHAFRVARRQLAARKRGLGENHYTVYAACTYEGEEAFDVGATTNRVHDHETTSLEAPVHSGMVITCLPS
jgi:hypothetical protein